MQDNLAGEPLMLTDKTQICGRNVATWVARVLCVLAISASLDCVPDAPAAIGRIGHAPQRDHTSFHHQSQPKLVAMVSFQTIPTLSEQLLPKGPEMVFLTDLYQSVRHATDSSPPTLQ